MPKSRTWRVRRRTTPERTTPAVPATLRAAMPVRARNRLSPRARPAVVPITGPPLPAPPLPSSRPAFHRVFISPAWRPPSLPVLLSACGCPIIRFLGRACPTSRPMRCAAQRFASLPTTFCRRVLGLLAGTSGSPRKRGRFSPSSWVAHVTSSRTLSVAALGQLFSRRPPLARGVGRSRDPWTSSLWALRPTTPRGFTWRVRWQTYGPRTPTGV